MIVDVAVAAAAVDSVFVFICSREGQKHECEWSLGANGSLIPSQKRTLFFLNKLFVYEFGAVFLHGLAFGSVHMCVCVLFATLFNITNMRTHCVRVHSTYM